MEAIAIAGCELIAELAPILLVYVLFKLQARRKGRPSPRLAAALPLALYLCAVLHITGAGTVYDLARFGLDVRLQQVNLVPFSDGPSALGGVSLNVLMFVPLGLLVPALWPRASRLLPVASFGFALSLAIELSQLLNNRATDVDDLVANTLGAVAGFMIYALWRAMRRSDEAHGRGAAGSPTFDGAMLDAEAVPPECADPEGGTTVPVFSMPPERGWWVLAEPALYAAAVLLGRFLFFDEFGLASMLYGF